MIRSASRPLPRALPIPIEQVGDGTHVIEAFSVPEKQVESGTARRLGQPQEFLNVLRRARARMSCVIVAMLATFCRNELDQVNLVTGMQRIKELGVAV